MSTSTNQATTSAKPAMARMSWPMPATQRRASKEPSPGVASWFMSAAFRALARLRGFGGGRGEDVFVGIHHGYRADRCSHQNSNTARQHTADSDQAGNQQEAKNNEPVFGNDSAA